MEGLNRFLDRDRLVFHPAVVGTPDDHGVVPIAQANVVTVISIHALFFVAGAEDDASIPVVSEQQQVGLHRVVSPFRRAGDQLSSALVRIIPDGALVGVPTAAVGVPFRRPAGGEGVTVVRL